ncbi:MAG: hypothetical protein Q7T51_01890 [Candidatus Moranbacteria bacterium]|nr:hypothetical protein [Candidatus Moranbacteria bacterium]
MIKENQPKRTFSSELIKKCQRIIFERSGKKITKDKAELYLEKFARYFMLAVKVLDQEEQVKKK